MAPSPFTIEDSGCLVESPYFFVFLFADIEQPDGGGRGCVNFLFSFHGVFMCLCMCVFGSVFVCARACQTVCVADNVISRLLFTPINNTKHKRGLSRLKMTKRLGSGA